ncbi:MAG: DUF4142 domain-containing protein [Caulobacteraceae bacterium]
MRKVNPAMAAAGLVLALAGCSRNATNANNGAVNTEANAAVANDAVPPAASVPAAAVTTAQDFVTAAAVSDMYEVAAAKLAQQKSKSAEVKAFAARMNRDHTASTDKLKKIIAAPGVGVSAPTTIDQRRQGMIDNLNAAAPGDFDKTYMDQQVAAHEEAASLFKSYGDNGDNARIKAFAAGVLPTIRSHLDMARKIDGSLKTPAA